jgi:hypothetical protein
MLVLAGAAALALTVSPGGAPVLAGVQIAVPAESAQTADAHDRLQGQRTILRVIENRETDSRVLQMMREKVDGLTKAQMRSVEYLCSRADAGDRSVAADLAYSLVTALIILS